MATTGTTITDSAALVAHRFQVTQADARGMLSDTLTNGTVYERVVSGSVVSLAPTATPSAFPIVSLSWEPLGPWHWSGDRVQPGHVGGESGAYSQLDVVEACPACRYNRAQAEPEPEPEPERRALPRSARAYAGSHVTETGATVHGVFTSGTPTTSPSPWHYVGSLHAARALAALHNELNGHA